MGRHLFGAAAVAYGVIALIWPGSAFSWTLAAAWIIGGSAIQFHRTAKPGAALLGAVYLVFALQCLPRIVDNWGNFFEQLSMATGAALIYPRPPSKWGRISLGLCAASFALVQAIYLKNTVDLVPNWLPPGRIFWAVATTVAFALAAIALLANRMALLATRLLTIMIASFGLLVWIPILFSHPPSHANWSETAETFAIAGATWILADLLGEHMLNGYNSSQTSA
jgi:hypothetical protein